MTAMLTDQHEHVWGPSQACLHCPARKCKRWACGELRVERASVCQKHWNGRSEMVPRARTVSVLTYSLPGACRAELR
jgi:hypothetical protein